MAGGTYTVQNKVLPGVYVNVVSEPRSLGTLGIRGTMTMALALNWGPSKQLVTINAGDDIRPIVGYDLTAPEALLIKEALKRALTLKLYNLAANTAATVTLGNLKATAKYGGTRGNDLSITVQEDIDTAGMFLVRTLLEGREMNAQRVTSVSQLVNNDWVTFTRTGAGDTLTASAGAPLVGGANGTVTNADHTDYLNVMETQDWNTMALVSDNNTLKSVYVSYIKRLRDGEGDKAQLVLSDYPTADYEGVISVKNGVVLADGTVISAINAVVWVAAATASAEVNESLTYSAYDDAVEVTIRYTQSQQIAAVQNGELVFIYGDESALVLQDINSFTSFEPEKNRDFSKNRVLRVVDAIANDAKRIFERSYIGKVDNDGDGRNLLKNELITYLTTLQDIGAVQNFDTDDITVLPGVEKDAVVVEILVQPVDSVEKVYMKVRVA